MREPVKGKTEAGRRREERARRTRSRIVDAAITRFIRDGYVATTIETIAGDAGVAPATVYQAFGTKQAILTRALDVVVAGDDAPVAVLERDWVARARQEADGRRRLALVVTGAAKTAARTAPIKEVIRDAAASDPAAAELLEQDTTRRYTTHTALVDLVLEALPLRAGVDRSTAAATFFALVNSDTHRLLVSHAGWTTKRWTRWLEQVLEQHLFGEEAGD